MPSLLTRLLVRIRRLHRSKGFGIQSPTDFWFANNIVGEQLPYYAYSELDKTACNWLDRKLGRLCFRLANWRQPESMPETHYYKWCQAACKKTKFCDMPDTISLAIVDINDTDRLKTILSRCNDQSVVVVDNINANKLAWKAICQSQQAVITFDLYYCGIVLFSKKRYKHNYTLYF